VIIKERLALCAYATVLALYGYSKLEKF